MGQQQLLLLVMGVIIVGVTIMAGIYAYQEKTRQMIADNLVNRNLEIANAAVYYKTKMDPFNGGNMSYANLADDGLGTLRMEITTNYGTFGITAATESTLEITGVSIRDNTIGARTYVTDYSITRTDIDYEGGITLDDEEG